MRIGFGMPPLRLSGSDLYTKDRDARAKGMHGRFRGHDAARATNKTLPRWVSLLVLMASCVSARAAQARPTVIELFTSEACSSCPPAEALLGQLAKQPGILALSFHVTYWNGPAWTDKYALTAATDRQSNYAALQHADNVYTPEAVIDGGPGIVGSDQASMTAAIAAAQASQPPSVPVTITGTTMLTIKIGDGTSTAQIWLFGYDSHHTTQIGGGENDGATITETNVVRSITTLGGWTGTAETYTIPKPAGDHMAVLVQTPGGMILGAGAE